MTTKTAASVPSSSSSSSPPSTTSSALSGKEGVCRIEVARVEWMVTQPWQRSPQTKSTGTGFCIDGRQILTNAHVVRSATDIRVRQHGSTRRFPASVKVYAPDVDLALLEIRGEKENADFFAAEVPPTATAEEEEAEGGEGTEEETKNANTNGGKKRQRRTLALEFAKELPALQESVHVVGFPTGGAGGNTICVTEGVVSRIDLVKSAYHSSSILAIQVDSAINPGNSGGPAFNAAGQVTGVAFSKASNKNTDNIGYLIPAQVVRAFLGRCTTTTTTTAKPPPTSAPTTDGGGNSGSSTTYTLSPSVPYRWHSLENKSLRLFHKVPDTVHGILLTSVCQETCSVLQVGDVLTAIDGKPIADDGQCVLRGDELIQHRYMLRGKRVDETTTFTVYRNGEVVRCEPCILRDIPSICLRWMRVDYQPDYLILGALVLLPLSWSLRSCKRCHTRLAAESIDWGKKWPSEWEGKEGLVVLVDILADELSFSYSRPWRRVVAYNGEPLRSLQHLRDLWDASCEQVAAAAAPAAPSSSEKGDAIEPTPTFARIELENDDDIVFEVKAAVEAQANILKTHQIPEASHISPPNPNYN